jgi:glycosyltransferase involved in cell wall biosynthesis
LIVMNPPLPSISIVTPSFNQGKFIEQTILSVLDQGYPYLEYMIIDGGSTDNTIEIIRNYEARLAYCMSEPDAGQAEAINKGWARSSGEILGWLNSDDYYLPVTFQKVAEAFRANPGAGVVYGLGHFVSETGEVIQTVGAPIDPQRMVNGGYYVLPQPAVFIRRTVIEKVGMLDTSFHYALDGEFFCRALANFDAIHLSLPLACLRLHGASKSVATGKGFSPEILRVAEKIINNPEAYPKCKVDRKAVLSGAYLNSARFLYNNGLYKDALWSLVQSLKISSVHARQILLREFPRLITHRLVGKQAYTRLSVYFSAIQMRRRRLGAHAGSRLSKSGPRHLRSQG